MNAVLPLKKALLICATVLLGFTITSWQDQNIRITKSIQDTVPPKREKKIVDLDEAINELDNAKADVEKSMRDIDWEKMNADIKDAMKNLDVDIKRADEDLKKTLAEIDVEKMRRDVETSMAKIDWDELKRSVEQAKEIDLDKVKAQVKKAKLELQKQKPQLEKSLRDARQSIEKAKTEMQAYKSFIDGLEGDGLINKKEGYNIEHKNGQLSINGKQQPAAVYNKYRAFLEKNKTFTLKKDDNSFDMNNE